MDRSQSLLDIAKNEGQRLRLRGLLRQIVDNIQILVVPRRSLAWRSCRSISSAVAGEIISSTAEAHATIAEAGGPQNRWRSNCHLQACDPTFGTASICD